MKKRVDSQVKLTQKGIMKLRRLAEQHNDSIEADYSSVESIDGMSIKDNCHTFYILSYPKLEATDRATTDILQVPELENVAFFEGVDWHHKTIPKKKDCQGVMTIPRCAIVGKVRQLKVVKG